MAAQLVLQTGSGTAAAMVIVAMLLGGGLVWGLLHLLGRGQINRARQRAEEIIEDSKKEAAVIKKGAEVEAKAEFIALEEKFKRETAETRTELKDAEKRLAKREDNLEKKLDTLVTKERKLEQTEKQVSIQQKAVAQKETSLDETLAEQKSVLLRISGMSTEDAKETLLERIRHDVEHEAASMTSEIVNTAKETAEDKAREIVLTSIQRYAAGHTSENTVSTVDIPSDDMKGRVIGREGRNIRAFEKVTGVDVIVDDTPGVVVVSAFDPVRREIARTTLERLIQDGRIHPARIEELAAECKKEVEKQIVEYGKQAAMDANVGGLHRKQIDLLGRLHFRTSYGQNVLMHSIEVAALCQVMAEELGLNGRLARRCGLLHDIGKAVDHEVEGGHPQIGADICKRFNEKPDVLNAIAGHHGDVEATSPYTALVMSADAISASRPGGRRESLERYVQRLEQLEAIATEFDGVSQAYAIQAGREVRVIVDANKVDDGRAVLVAREIAKRIEQESTYPGEVKVTLLRELRAVEYAR